MQQHGVCPGWGESVASVFALAQISEVFTRFSEQHRNLRESRHSLQAEFRALARLLCLAMDLVGSGCYEARGCVLTERVFCIGPNFRHFGTFSEHHRNFKKTRNSLQACFNALFIIVSEHWRSFFLNFFYQVMNLVGSRFYNAT